MVKRDYYEFLGVERNAPEKILNGLPKLSAIPSRHVVGRTDKKAAEEKFKRSVGLCTS